MAVGDIFSIPGLILFRYNHQEQTRMLKLEVNGVTCE